MGSNCSIAKYAAILFTTLVISGAQAADAPSAKEISNAVSGHTYQGSMSSAGSVFSEYYEADGNIRGKDYKGKWRTEDGKMCFQYGDKPERCFGITLEGPSMVMLKDGKIDGNGMLISGNRKEHETVWFGAGRSEQAAPYQNFFIERYAQAYALQLDAFADALETGAPCAPSLQDGVNAARLAEAAYLSIAERRMIRVDEIA